MTPTPHQALKAALSEIAALLGEGGHYERLYEGDFRAAIGGSPQSLEDVLRSGDLWGGMGSIVDCAFATDSARNKIFRRLMIGLGKLQIEAGLDNAGVRKWVGIFEEWEKKGV
jgi:hypothetical protein